MDIATLIVAMYEFRMINILLVLTCSVLEALSAAGRFRGGIIMVRPKIGGAPKEVNLLFMTLSKNCGI